MFLVLLLPSIGKESFLEDLVFSLLLLIVSEQQKPKANQKETTNQNHPKPN